jgi:Ser/Thr protein kinase RdoA (MazF antagonist)
VSEPLAAVLGLIGAPVVRLELLDARGHPWLVDTAAGQAVLRRTKVSLASVAWLHAFLDRLGETDFPAPRPLRWLDGSSFAETDGAVWETLSFVPGRQLGLDSDVPLERAGALLARFHLASLTVSPVDQRPGADPMETCRPRAEPCIVERFHDGLRDLDHSSAMCCVVHGDCTVSNLLTDGHDVVGMVDFALAHLGPPESDISCALWVNGRVERLDVPLDATRIHAFVAGYHGVRPLSDWAVRAIPLYLVGRGLQMYMRIERGGASDELQLQRIRWLDVRQEWLTQIIARALA